MVAARELQRENHAVTVFEQSERSGGVWVYSDEVEAEDLTGWILRPANRSYSAVYYTDR